MSGFRVGQKVVLVDDTAWSVIHEANRSRLTFPTVGLVYTVRAAWISPNRGWSIALMEIDNSHVPHRPEVPEPGFQARRFRPVAYPKQSQSTDIALIKSMIKTVKVDA